MPTPRRPTPAEPGARVLPDDAAAPPPDLAAVRDAAERIRGRVVRTPLVRLPVGAPLWAKAENLQRTGSFKLRGATNFLARMTPEARARGVCAHSSGNHAQGVAAAAAAWGVPAAIAIPEGAPEIKVARTRALGAEVVRCDGSTEGRDAAARRFVEERGMTLVPPFDHPWIVEGQGTVGLEIVEALADLDDLDDLAEVLVPTGGGGLLAGVATAVKALRPDVRVLGVEPSAAADATESFARGARVEWSAARTTSTVADGVRTQAIGATNWAAIRRLVDGFVTVDDREILDAAAWMLREARIVPEPTGALTLAGWRRLRRGEAELPPLPSRAGASVVIVSGGNLDPAVLAELALLEPRLEPDPAPPG